MNGNLLFTVTLLSYLKENDWYRERSNDSDG